MIFGEKTKSSVKWASLISAVLLIWFIDHHFDREMQDKNNAVCNASHPGSVYSRRVDGCVPGFPMAHEQN